jgi:hypothetical protein
MSGITGRIDVTAGQVRADGRSSRQGADDLMARGAISTNRLQAWTFST